MQPHDTTHDVPYGYCHCGCGQKTNPIKANSRRGERAKGEPCKYIKGHQNRKFQHEEGPNPSGLCMCGCGQPAPLAKKTNRAAGHIKGKPTRFVAGHAACVPKHKTVEEQFWLSCTEGAPDDCWEWQASTSLAGYGQMKIGGTKGRNVGAHRVSYEINLGPIPEGMMVCHHCDNPRCCNPNHLFLGSAKDNVHDMLAKKRNGYSGNPGETHPSAKLSNDDVRKIRELWIEGVSQSEIGRRFGISQTTVWSIVHRETWTHLP